LSRHDIIEKITLFSKWIFASDTTDIDFINSRDQIKKGFGWTLHASNIWAHYHFRFEVK